MLAGGVLEEDEDRDPVGQVFVSGHRARRDYHGEPCVYEAFEQVEDIWGRDPCAACWFSNRAATSFHIDT